MATFGANALTMLDWAKRLGPDDNIAAVIELLSLSNPILKDMLVLEGNLTTGHKSTVRTGIPRGTWRLLNYGVDMSKSTVQPVIDTAGNLEDEVQIDVDLAKLNGNTAAFRLSEANAHLEGLNQQMAETLFYGNTAVTPERFMGLSPRYNSLNPAVGTSANVIDGGSLAGQSDNTSIWFVTWGENTIHGFFPKGKKAGLEQSDKGEQRVYDSTGRPYWAFVDHFKWELGLAVRDWRYAVRICNIDVSDLSTVNAANIINLLVRAGHRLPTTGGRLSSVTNLDGKGTPSGSNGRSVIYCNRTVGTYLDLQAMNKANVQLTHGEWGGEALTMFRGVPIRETDALLNTEARVTV